MSKELSIMMTDGNKKTEFTISDFDSDYQLAVIDGLFKFFEVKVDFKEMVEIYRTTGKAYKDFYSGEVKEFTEVNEPKVAENPQFKEQYVSAFTEGVQEVKPVYSNTRIKDGVTTYKCHYICSACGKRGNKYIREFDRTVDCFDCFTTLPVYPAIENGNLDQDGFGNYFIGGEFKRRTVIKEDQGGMKDGENDGTSAN